MTQQQSGGAPTRADIVFRNAYLVTLDDDRRVYRDGNVRAHALAMVDRNDGLLL